LEVGGMAINLENQKISTTVGWTVKHQWARYRSVTDGDDSRGNQN